MGKIIKINGYKLELMSSKIEQIDNLEELNDANEITLKNIDYIVECDTNELYKVKKIK